MESINIRKCSNCGSSKTLTDWRGRTYWRTDKIGGFLCNICYKKKWSLENAECIKDYDKSQNDKTIEHKVGNKRVKLRLKFNPRKYKCQKCNKKFKKTGIYRLRGHDDDEWEFRFNPLGFVIELCQGCASREGYVGSRKLKMSEPKKIIHINKNIIQQNAKHGTKHPVCRIQIGNKTTYSMGVIINGPSRLVYRPDDPLSCGAKLWIETFAKVELIN